MYKGGKQKKGDERARHSMEEEEWCMEEDEAQACEEEVKAAACVANGSMLAY